LADREDVQRLISELDESTIIYQHNETNYAHLGFHPILLLLTLMFILNLDFTWAFNANKRIYGDAIDILTEYAP